MKIRKRLSPERAMELGLKVKPKDGKRNPRYMVEIDKLYPSQEKKKILLFDIETSPMRSYTWSCWKQNIGTNQIISDWFILTWSAKWLFEDEVLSDKLTGEEVLREDDERVTKSLFDLLDEADITISYSKGKHQIFNSWFWYTFELYQYRHLETR
jgi:hypothetical protein